MEDWENDLVPPVLKKEQPRNMWDHEDGEENDVMEYWEAEDETTQAPPPKPPALKVPKNREKANEK